MRKGTLLLAIGLTAFAVPGDGLAQVYSNNVVGYVNKPLAVGFNFLSNPLAASDDTLTNILAQWSPPEGAALYLWDVPNQRFRSAAAFSSADGGWLDPVSGLPADNLIIGPGLGFVLKVPVASTILFVGTVRQGTFTTAIAGGNKFSLVGSQVPIAGGLSTQLMYAGTDGDQVYSFLSSGQVFRDAVGHFGAAGWYDPSLPGTREPTIEAADGFFIQHSGTDASWVQVFQVQSPVPALQSLAATPTSGGPAVRSLKTREGQVTLTVANPDGGAYDLQFSSDGVAWKTIATKLTATTWTGPRPASARGYYQLVRP